MAKRKASEVKVPRNSMKLEELEDFVKQMEEETVKMRAKKIRMRKLEKKSKVELKRIEKKCNQLRKVKRQLVEESAWAQVCSDIMHGIVSAEDEGDAITVDLLTRSLRELMMPRQNQENQPPID
ncbi:PREDICTED: uncharacterized protein LOC18599294 isoform X1 [Theobroma cacao]|uniref:Uncharacterized protein LOC18599294 isoform X1 n=1 Tax=Theobroma cacao TaxID=3641 RepID=A0AB32V540_THECC|nr:PREDICTED: uncharacterized protein LOC18599294 isoform X1 [Theobroma cacao]